MRRMLADGRHGCGTGWTYTSDEESITGIYHAEDIGVYLLETTTSHGTGHSQLGMGQVGSMSGLGVNQS